MGKYILLIGNGINNIHTNYSWKQLIIDLINYTVGKGKIQIDHKPFPLLYEEIVALANRQKNIKENEIKQFIFRQIQQLKPNQVHQRIMLMKAQHILTTNYDFTLEQVLTERTDLLKNEGFVRENVYSIFRNHRVEDKIFWHIHGVSNQAGSITLRYEHYSGYLQQMRNYIATGTSYTHLKLDPLVGRIKAGKLTRINSWLDFFFTRNIYILGLTLDFIEIHLWWLLTYRQREIHAKRLKLNNTITYFYPDIFENKIKHRLQLLTAYEIKIKSIPFDEKKAADYYLQILDKIEKENDG